MLRTNVYIPDELNTQINNKAKVYGKSKSEVIREALVKGLNADNGQKSKSAQTLLDLVHMAKSFPGTGPSDLSINHDYYTWGGKKRSGK